MSNPRGWDSAAIGFFFIGVLLLLAFCGLTLCMPRGNDCERQGKHDVRATDRALLPDEVKCLP